MIGAKSIMGKSKYWCAVRTLRNMKIIRPTIIYIFIIAVLMLSAFHPMGAAHAQDSGKIVADKILIEKAERKLTLFRKGKAIKTYKVALGGQSGRAKGAAGETDVLQRASMLLTGGSRTAATICPSHFLSECGGQGPGRVLGRIAGRQHNDSRYQERLWLAWISSPAQGLDPGVALP